MHVERVLEGAAFAAAVAITHADMLRTRPPAMTGVISYQSGTGHRQTSQCKDELWIANISLSAHTWGSDDFASSAR
jgi:hypothetical protein